MCDCEGAHSDACRMRSYRARRSRSLALRRQAAATAPATRAWSPLVSGLDGAGVALRVARRIVPMGVPLAQALLAGLVELDQARGAQRPATPRRRNYPPRADLCACGRCEAAPRAAPQARYASRSCSAVAARDRRQARVADLRALAALTAPELAPFLRILLDLREPVEVRIAGRLILVTEAELARLLDAAEREKR